MLKLSAVALTGGAVGAGLTTSIAPKATAAETDFTVTGDELVIRDEALAALWLTIDAEWSYAVPSGEHPETVVVDVLAGDSTDTMDTVASAESSEVFLEASGAETIEADLLDANVVDAKTLVPAEGEIEETTIYVGTEMRVYDENGLVIAADSQTDTATVTIERDEYNPDEYGTVGGAGELTVEVE